MLFASTRLTLVRELGIERFRQTIFATEKSELTAAGWARHEASEKVDAPLTEEESGLQGVKDAEAREAQGTSARRGHVTSRVDVKVGEGVVEALSGLKEDGCKGTLVQLKYMLPDETLQLDSTTDGVEVEDVGRTIEAKEPRYSFYSHPGSGGEEARVVFVYTCPTNSKIKERMIYSTGKSWTRTVAERDAGLTIAKSLEATETSEITAEMLNEGVPSSAATQDSRESGTAAATAGAGFARPKRPGRRT
jgi:twinfilin-like protein